MPGQRSRMSSIWIYHLELASYFRTENDYNTDFAFKVVRGIHNQIHSLLLENHLQESMFLLRHQRYPNVCRYDGSF
ncbi:hypothetical protein SUGI_0998190 [Cryptomeria japonica]|nr:hypothetical protein SUGI_0998190 [Cryptomeria japonica]